MGAARNSISKPFRNRVSGLDFSGKILDVSIQGTVSKLSWRPSPTVSITVRYTSFKFQVFAFDFTFFGFRFSGPEYIITESDASRRP